jgi:3-methyladenine DNA glycosylase AlkC
MSDNKTSPQQLKTLFNRSVIEKIGQMVGHVWSQFDADIFVSESLKGFDELALKQRSAQIADVLYDGLNVGFEQAADILLKSMGDDNGTGGIEGYTDFAYLPFLDVVERHGTDFPKVALETLERMTVFFSAEFAVRPYILVYPEFSISYLNRWATHSDWRVRRLASEGSRPRLPWGIQLKPFIDDPIVGLQLLEQLYRDENLTVRRSVANHLNDIAKDHPDVVTGAAKRWWRSHCKLAQWTVKHGLRTLIKQGNPEALAVLGFVGGDNVLVHDFTLSSDKVLIGEKIEFQFRLHSEEAESSKLVVDYVLERPLASGKTAKKVFKLKTLTLDSNQSVSIKAKQVFKQLSTRTYYVGIYTLGIMINGRVTELREFELTLS